ncbi:tyrosine-type recombinase/integrase [Pyruvatibacter mobilis]|uniref:Tyrosine-type recombinase/integrase n=1 Tax=Pyruvatibacter mobilis TaxID=1712261 RepID=A0A845Q8W5_9HYPH|nr:site-specific integrase [Pyruvatibacter mobilis]NBG94521.1 tyrosine-type recombinase/integrase [Pyruvatibacter mobilis]QJD74040.1 site-specific integrase [Pyruvatibacter mobilis]GGD03620.1 integrase [Pyruvatibacter mobilis]
MAVRRKGTKWQADVTVKGQRLPRYSFNTEEEAKAWEMEARAAAILGKPIPVPDDAPIRGGKKPRRVGGPWTLEQAFRETHTKYWKGTAHGRKQTHNIRQIEEFFGPHLPVTEIGTEEIEAFVAACIEKGNSGSTINRKLSCLSKALNLAQTRGHLTVLPKIERAKENQGRIRWLSDAEEQAFHHYFGLWGDQDRLDAFVCLIDTGFRPSELWTLEARDINFGLGMITLWENKTNWPRSIHMTGRVKEVLLRRTDGGRHGPFDFGLSTEEMGRWFLYGWDRVRAELGLSDDPQFVPYALRHTCCSRLIQRGVDLVRVKEWMGHKTTQTTMRYAHLAPKHLASLVDALEQPREVA